MFILVNPDNEELYKEIEVKEKDLKNIEKILLSEISNHKYIEDIFFRGDSIFDQKSQKLMLPDTLNSKEISEEDKEYPIMVIPGSKIHNPNEKKPKNEEKKQKKRISKVDIQAEKYNVNQIKKINFF